MDSHFNNRVLITGIGGFTGRHLKKHLEKQGMEVYGTTYTSSSMEDTFPVNLTDAASVLDIINKVEPSYIVHLAAISFVGHGDAAEFYRVNVVGTENLLQSVIKSKANVKKVIVASSANIYGNTDVDLISESFPPEPVNHYACSKMAMEKIVANYYTKLPIIITRPFNYTGVGQAEHFLVPKIVSHFKQQKSEIELGNLDVYRDFSSVDFVVNAYAKLLQSDVKSEVFNICSGNSYSLKQIIESLEAQAGYKINVSVNPAFVRADEVKKITGDNNKLLNLFPELKVIRLEEVLESMLLVSE
ncbi:UDP-glucose 4-epimerase [Pseudoalteromonas atlantica]|uniref:UDP-glucose 4-epimerase n=1 Tax=Pseudoalteromonas atlantica TaxID=288 RepID=A0ABQ0ULF5_PSEAF|nr:UDP-glucose 4-epimerase [Pseudoalteromonas atlantica]